jgi:hypothetical protein
LSPVAKTGHRPIEERYLQLVHDMKRLHGIRVNRWRSSTTGCAWEVYYHDGRVSRLIEAPYPRGPVSVAVFLHEVGHHAIGMRRYKPRCLEEFKAWEWSLNTMREYGFNVSPSVENRVRASLEYAVGKAMRRGLRKLPAELAPFAPEGGRVAAPSAASVAKRMKQRPRTEPKKKVRFRILWLFPIH